MNHNNNMWMKVNMPPKNNNKKKKTDEASSRFVWSCCQMCVTYPTYLGSSIFMIFSEVLHV